MTMLGDDVDPRTVLRHLGWEAAEPPERIEGGWDTLLYRFATADGLLYDLRMDIGPVAKPDGVISTEDIFGMVAQFGDTCDDMAQNLYDGDGLRVERWDKDADELRRTEYVWDVGAGLPQVLEEKVTLDPNGTSPTEVTFQYIYGVNLIARYKVSGPDPSETLFLYDGLGSVRELRDRDGQSVGVTYDYDVFGALRSVEPPHSNAFRFTGEYQDFNSDGDLLYLRNRHYDPELGRFWTRDPWPGTLLDPATLNPYAYVGNNPANFVDPLGLCPNKNPLKLVWDCAQEAWEQRGEAASWTWDRVGRCEAFMDPLICAGARQVAGLATELACWIDKESYFDLNVTVPVYGSFGVVTGGAQVSCAQGLHPYIGGGAGTLGFSLTRAEGQPIREGLGCGIQVFFGVGGQVGFTWPGWGGFSEAGFGTQGASLTCYLVGGRFD